jgi:hypothetical protein
MHDKRPLNVTPNLSGSRLRSRNAAANCLISGFQKGCAAASVNFALFASPRYRSEPPNEQI